MDNNKHSIHRVMKTGISRRAAGKDNDINYANVYLTFVPLEDATFTFTQRGTGSLYYSIDGAAWVECQSGVATPTVQVGSEIRWKGNLSPLTSASTSANNGLGVFSATGDFDAKGNPLSLTDSDLFVGVREIPKSNYCIASLFNGNTNLVNAENLSLCCIKTRQNCYYAMFAGCTSLLTPPAINTGDAVYQSFMSMFSGCTSLEYGPNLTSIKTFAQSAVRAMFNNCTSMRTINFNFPESENMSTYSFYQMFRNCSNLELSPVLPAKTLKTGCYYQMFYGCSKINRITCLATDISASNCTNGWVNGVSASGTFVKAATMTDWTTGTNGIPTGWTVINQS